MTGYNAALQKPPINLEQVRRDSAFLALSTFAASVIAFFYYFRHNTTLLYGDAVAHINIARRVFDSRTPGLFQLGTVWLPLPHILDMPFVAVDGLWRNGGGASLPSMLAYMAGTMGIFRLVRGLASRGSAWIAALIFALNPNLLYMQATAMTESLYLALFIWTVVFLSEFVQAAGVDERIARRSLEKCALLLSAAMLVRYDAWFLAAFVAGSAVCVLWRRNTCHGSTGTRRKAQVPSSGPRGLRVSAAALRSIILLPALTAALWLAYNFGMFGNPLEFATGPYSARAIQQRSKTVSMPTYPGENSPRDATLYFLKISRLNVAEGSAEEILFAAAIISLICVLYFGRRFWPYLLLWVPLPFYVISIAWGSVPIFFPEWYPHSYYNVRYGLQLLPAMTVFVAVGCEFLKSFVSMRLMAAAAAIAITLSYVPLWRSTPICLREAEANGSARLQFDQALASELKKLPRSATLLMEASVHPGALQQAGIPFRCVIRETNFPEWTVALSRPAESADYIVAFSNDEVARALRRSSTHLEPIARVGAPDGTAAVIYRSLAR